jgi:hypothetical protein
MIISKFIPFAKGIRDVRRPDVHLSRPPSHPVDLINLYIVIEAVKYARDMPFLRFRGRTR